MTETNSKKYSVILDMDNTLMSSIHRNIDKDEQIVLPGKYDFTYIDPPFCYYIYLRPHLIDFLEEIKKNSYVILYTNAMKDYADAIIDHIGRHYFDEVITRVNPDDCLIKTTEKVTTFSEDKEKYIIIDDNLETWHENNKKNVLQINYFCPMTNYDYTEDMELLLYKKFLGVLNELVET